MRSQTPSILWFLCGGMGFFAFSSQALAIDLGGLQISLAGDLVYDQGISKESTAQEKLTMRSAELMFYAPVDHLFDGVISAAAHDESGETLFELHEMHVSNSKLIPRTTLRIGQFFLPIGRLNRFHQHDWPFTSTPKVNEVFFDSEGVFDSGLDVSYLLPTDFYLNLNVGVTSGYRFGHSHTAGSKPKVPTHFSRVSTFVSFSEPTDGAEIGLNYLGRTDSQETVTNIGGLDFTAKWRERKKVQWLTQVEVWFRSARSPLSSGRQVGLYIYNQYGLSRMTALGLRLDGYKDLNKTNSLTGKKMNNIEYLSLVDFSLKTSEFLTIRPTLSYSFLREEGTIQNRDLQFTLQTVFILGGHPAHDF